MKNIILFFLLLFTTASFSQKKETFVIPDSLKNTSFTELEKRFERSFSNNKIKKLYARVYYKKSKFQNDKIILANGLYLYAISFADDKDALKCSDSIIALTKNSDDFNYPAKGYILKSNFLMKNMDLKSSLNNILEAEKYSSKKRNIEQNLMVNQQIALIKIELGKAKEALPLILKNYEYFKSKDAHSVDYLYTTWILSDIYIRLKKIDTALNYIKILQRQINSGNRFYEYSIMYEGICYHFKNQYAKSDIFLDKAITMLASGNDKLNLAISYYYRGENILQNEKNIIKAQDYFEKADSILVKSGSNTADLHNNCVRLIEISKKLKNNDKQLYYLNRLIEIDSYLNKNGIILQDNINKNYERPHLLLEKEKVIVKMNIEKNLYIGIGFIIFIGLGFSLFNLSKIKRQNKLYKNRVNELHHKYSNENKALEIEKSIIETAVTETKENNTKTVDLSKEKAIEILKKIDQFEKNKGYLEQNINQIDFARKLETNSTYLSKTINQYKNKNFSQYINDLRIEHTVKRLSEDKKFRNYSIKAISEEVGFSNSESFSKAFLKKTGYQPSYFIKNSEK
ncbi:AraC family transcriptional regulator [Flavobacterium sp. LHD-85]|uniref:helix-turn-helix domain-containing protein n=1 Tax=Flavobacterium sp. LHD-85 TaxID=3071410 RepID=UPI0027E08553|nr:AraC family transcriptional regulator [Flavobacterium sp. LHD-85]MDQ6531239.1 AraC family transcriptional regulator [Flavobacterium sp. LHD-85]